MRTLTFSTLLAAVLLVAGSSHGVEVEAAALTVDDVLTMAARLPASEERLDGPLGGFERAPYARPIAEAIASTVDGSLLGIGRLREEGALMLIYAAFESGLRRCVPGDGGRAWGPWQEQHVPRAVACDPARAARRWYALALEGARACKTLPEVERLAFVASGNCGHGRQLARRRGVLAQKVAIEL